MPRKDSVTYSFWVSTDQKEALDALSARTMIPKSQLVRRGIDMVIAEMEEREEIIERAMEDEEDE